MKARALFSTIGPGILVAATGVGAGDLATASFTGSQLGCGVLWAVLVGAVMKYVLNEGIARWQLATGETFLEGVLGRFGKIAGWVFLSYLLLWSFFVGSALMSACGVTIHALVPVLDRPEEGKILFGIASSALGAIIALRGGFRVFERMMGVCILAMFLTVMLTAGALWPGTRTVLSGLLVPSIPGGDGAGLSWTVALIGGIGGTLTILCYSYWIREEGRAGLESLGLSRVDLAIGYTVTAAFGLGMVLIGSTIKVQGRGAGLLVELASALEGQLGPVARWAFLLGAFGAVFSSLLGVWQAVPYLFADAVRIHFGLILDSKELSRSRPYRLYLLGLGTVPILGLLMSFKEVQKLYALIGAGFLPLLAALLLVMNGRRAWVGSAVNGWPSRVALGMTLAFFLWSLARFGLAAA